MAWQSLRAAVLAGCCAALACCPCAEDTGVRGAPSPGTAPPSVTVPPSVTTPPGVAGPLDMRGALVRAEPGTPVACEPPVVAVLREMHELCEEHTRLDIKKRYFKRSIEREPSRREAATAELQQIDERIAQIQDRLEAIERGELGEFERVAGNAVLGCDEEPLYGQPSYGIILYANATGDIRENELLLFHADGVYRTKGSFPKLTTTGVGWYFRPNRDIPSGSRFVVACIQDAPEEIRNVKNGYMPDSDRARDPSRAYNTQIFVRNGGQ